MRAKNILKYVFDSNYRFLINDATLHCYDKWDDRKYLEKKYRAITGQRLNIDNPKTYNEKLQWLKINDRKDIYTTMVDKYLVKEYVSSIIGSKYIIPTLGVWDKFEDIEFDRLPEQFVLKCTHDSGGLAIVKDKEKYDFVKAKLKIEKSLKHNFFFYGREWPYKNVKPRIIAEEFMVKKQSDNASPQGQQNGVLNDYKFYTFNGKVKLCMINTDRGINTCADYFDSEFNWLDFTWGYPHAAIKPEKPKQFEEMIALAEKLAKGTIELRVDFYIVDERIYFGELTFFDGSGFDLIEPHNWDLKLGDLIDLNAKE